MLCLTWYEVEMSDFLRLSEPPLQTFGTFWWFRQVPVTQTKHLVRKAHKSIESSGLRILENGEVWQRVVYSMQRS
jgi:hypothetical protein